MIIGKKQIQGDLFEYYAGDTLPVDFTQITDVKECIYAATQNFKDYKWIRKYLKTLDYNTLNNDDKLILCRYKATTIENCKDVLGDTYDYWMTNFGTESTNCRKYRFEIAKTILIKNIDFTSQFTVLGFLNSTQLEKNYKEYGIEGTSEGDLISGILDFLESTGDYTTTGLGTMTITMLDGVLKEDLIISLAQCIRNGNY